MAHTWRKETTDTKQDNRREPIHIDITPPDLGSYIGSHSLVVAASQPDREVVAVDPDPRNLALIR